MPNADIEPVMIQDFRVISPTGRIMWRANIDLRDSKEWKDSPPGSMLEQAWSTNSESGWNVILAKRRGI